MSSKGIPTFALVVGFVATASAATASDPWEFASTSAGDDTFFSPNTLSHGLVQQHDLDEAGGNNDQDWMVVPTIAGHSYEARLSGTNVSFDSSGGCPMCAQFERVDSAGTVLTNDSAVVSGIPNISYDRTVRWIAPATDNEFIRVMGNSNIVEAAIDVYTIRFWDTTYAVPRWNNAGSQLTVFLISNLTNRAIAGQIDFYNASGLLLLTQPIAIGSHQLSVFNTSSAPALAGSSGHAYVAHDAGYGGLAGKAVALEPSTGFSFDTPLTPFVN